MTTAAIEPVVLTATGVWMTIAGSFDLAKGRIKEGTGAVITGMTSANLGGRLQELDPSSHSKLMKWTLGAGTGAVGVQGATRLAMGVKQKCMTEILKGAIQTAAGIAGTLFIYSLDSRIIVVAHQASLMALSSAFIAKLGLSDLFKGRFRPGICKVIFGLGGIALSGYYAYCSLSQKETLAALSPDHIAFLEDHREEIEKIYTSKTPTGNWSKLGSGVAKRAFIHPDFPGMLIKVPNEDRGYRGPSGEDDMTINHENLSQIRNIATSYDRIVLPASHLYQTHYGRMIVEQRLVQTPGYEIPDGPEKQAAFLQFRAFEQETGLCDLNPQINHNAGFISHTSPLQIGVIDFDCRRRRPPASAIISLTSFAISATAAATVIISTAAAKIISTAAAKTYSAVKGFLAR